MRTKLPSCLLLASLALPAAADDRSRQILSKATEVFGNRLSEHDVFRLNQNYVLWLVTATDGSLTEVIVGPKSHYSTEFPNQARPSAEESLSQSEYQEALSRISELKDIGQLTASQYGEIPGYLGPLQTDEFENGFVEKVLRPEGSGAGSSNEVWKFSVYFMQTVSGSPKQIAIPDDEPPQVCLGQEWYYVPAQDARRLRIGKRTTFRAAGASGISRHCFRTATPYDADGFTIEDPQTETIIAAEAYAVRSLVGRVHFSDMPIEGVNVEVLPAGKTNVIAHKNRC